ncbi:MAG: hypothetical protein ACJ754_19260 [Pyrinomonadaceae bacterium]
MSNPDSPHERPAAHDGQRASNIGAVSINPTRYQIDDKFPELGFDINTGGLPFYEVLLATHPGLFSPDQYAQRNDTNFHASRFDAAQPTLTAATGQISRYLVQPHVLKSFAETKQEPKAIYYTLIAYGGADGRDPAFAHDPAKLPAQAPSVIISKEFKGHTLSTVLGIPAHMLVRVSAPQSRANGANGYATQARAGMLGGEEAGDDTGEGEDGYNIAAQGLSDESEEEWAESVAYSAEEADDDSTPQDAYELYKTQAYEGDDGDAWGGGPAAGGASLGAGDYGEDEDDLYSDGFEQAGPIRSMQALQSAAQSSAFPAEMGEPEDLYDGEGESDGAGLSSEDGDDDYDFASSLSAESGHDSYAADYAAAGEPAFAAGAHGHNGNGDAARARYTDISGGDDYSSGLSYDDGYGVAEGGSRPLGYGAAYGDEAELAYQALDDGSKLEAAIDQKNLSPEEIRRIKEKVRIIEHITKDESGNDLYKAANRDGEFEGKFGKKHPAYQKFHVGLSYGIIQFTQDSGELGRLLELMKTKDRNTFVSVFGDDYQKLLDVTKAAGPSSKDSPDGRSHRVQPVGGKDLWEDEWIARFQKAAAHPLFQAAQIELAAKDFLDPMLPFAKSLGLDTDRALTMIVDRAVQMGVGGARRWIIKAVGPVKTPTLLQQVLAALGHADLKSFQKAKGLKNDGELGAMTHAALVEELRKKGAVVSPVPVPDAKQMMEAMVRESAGQSWGRRVKRIYEAKAGFDDKPVQL